MSARADDALIGQVIGKRYLVKRLIGRGGMGAIYEIQHIKLNRSFALKTLTPELAQNADALQRFQREADVVAGLRHPSIVEIVDWEHLPDGTPCIVMEYLEGENLATRLSRRGPLPWITLARLSDQIFSALIRTHRAGIVHRDLKPQNIFILYDEGEHERCKLLDFGVSKISGGGSMMTATGKLLGTPLYMSPEQAEGKGDEIGPAADVWAMGAIVFEMATAKQAFAASSTPSVLYRICHGIPEPMTPFRPDVPHEFATLISRVLSRDKNRIMDVRTFRRELFQALSSVLPGLLSEPSQTTGEVPKAPDWEDGKTRPDDKASRSGPAQTTLSRMTGESVPIVISGLHGKQKVAIAGGALLFIVGLLWFALGRGGAHRPASDPKAAATTAPAPFALPTPSPAPQPSSTPVDAGIPQTAATPLVKIEPTRAATRVNVKKKVVAAPPRRPIAQPQPQPPPPRPKQSKSINLLDP